MKQPQRKYLTSDTYDVLLDAIQSGMWENQLPGERYLCEQFQVSRTTLRHALKKLEGAHFIKNQQGKHRKIIYTKPARLKNKRKDFVITIGFLSPIPTRVMAGHTNRKIAEIEHILHQKEFHFKLCIRPGCYSKSPDQALELLMKETQIQCWIIQHSTREMQIWFEKHNIPAVLTGSSHEGISLPFVDRDNAAVCRHAAGLLIARNRKTIYYLALKHSAPGDIQCDVGFKEGVKKDSNVVGRIIRSDTTPEKFRSLLGSLLASNRSPDAYLIDNPSYIFTAVTYFLQKGYRIPEDIAIICRTDSREFSYMTPSIAHYTTAVTELSKRTAASAVKLALGESVEIKGVLLTPDFVPGKSI